MRRLATIAAVSLLAPLVIVSPAAGQTVSEGNYAYDQPPNAGAATDMGQTGLLSFGQGALADASAITRAQWVGDGVAKYKEVSIIFDLLKDYPLEQVILVSNAPNRYYGIKSVSVRTRAEAEPDYTSVHAQTWYGTASPLPPEVSLNNSLTIALNQRTARFLIVNFTRLHEYHHMVLNDVIVNPAVGEPEQNPAPPLTADALRGELVKPVKQIPRPGFADIGGYYASVTPDDGIPDNAGGVVPFLYGELFNRDVSRNVGWRGRADAPKSVSVVFDLHNDYPLDRIKLISKAPNQFWGFDEYTVTFRPQSAATYRVAGRGVRTRAELDYAVDIPMSGQVTRFIRVEFSRINQYLHVPLSEVELHVTGGAAGQNPAPPYDITQMQQELARYTRLVDEFGQYLYQDWPGKVTSAAQMRADHQAERDRLRSVVRDPAVYDRFGGVKTLGRQQADGFFRIRKIDGRWWFVTPDGYPFLLKGVDSVSHNEWGYGTIYKNPDGSPRDVFDGLPDPVRYPGAYTTTERGHTVSFVKANLMAKYGNDWEGLWRKTTARRLTDWGFNGLSKWARDPDLTFPYIEQVSAPADVIRVLWAIDPYDPEFEAKLDRHANIAGLKDDAWLIGYFFDNERGWNNDVVKEILLRDGSLPAKKAFVTHTSTTYNGDLAQVNGILGTTANSWDELAATAIDLSRVPAADVKSFIRQASNMYYATVRRSITKQDPNHLFLGSALVPTWHSSLDWNTGGIEHLDAISLDVYSDSAGYLADYEALDKPVLNLEYSFNTADRGLRAINASVRAQTIAERGEKYRAFLEAQAKSPVFVGSGWFVYYDQAVTGRPGDGESYNFGLLNQQDQPYAEMTAIMRDTNLTLELVHRYGTSDITAQMVADSITSIWPVDQRKFILPLPAMPEAFTAAVATSSHPGIIGLDGTITAPSQTTIVTITLRITRISDSTSALTRPLQVWVPRAPS